MRTWAKIVKIKFFRTLEIKKEFATILEVFTQENQLIFLE